MKILVRLPNWLGDMVMATGVLHQLPHFFPDATLHVIAKKGLHELLDFFPPAEQAFVFAKEDYPGIRGLWQFGRNLRRAGKFDLFLTLPDSFSAALMGYASGAKMRVGYRKEGRDLLLTHAYSKPKGGHRVDEYIHLLEVFTRRPPAAVEVGLHHRFPQQDYLVVNINSEAASRRLTTEKAVEILSAIREANTANLVLIGGPKEQAFVEEVLRRLPNKRGVESLAGKTSLKQLVEVLASARAVLTTDSGPAHLANALGTPTVVLFGAGNENNTAPYNRPLREVLRLGKLSCEPCTKNVCIQFGTPQCLALLDTAGIVAAVQAKTESR